MGLSETLTTLNYNSVSGVDVSPMTLLQHSKVRGSIHCAMVCSNMEGCEGYGFNKTDTLKNCILLQSVVILGNSIFKDIEFKQASIFTKYKM